MSWGKSRADGCAEAGRGLGRLPEHEETGELLLWATCLGRNSETRDGEVRSGGRGNGLREREGGRIGYVEGGGRWRACSSG